MKRLIYLPVVLLLVSCGAKKTADILAGKWHPTKVEVRELLQPEIDAAKLTVRGRYLLADDAYIDSLTKIYLADLKAQAEDSATKMARSSSMEYTPDGTGINGDGKLDILGNTRSWKLSNVGTPGTADMSFNTDDIAIIKFHSDKDIEVAYRRYILFFTKE